MSTGWTELIRAKASIYALEEATKTWIERGSSGQLWLYQNSADPVDLRVKWTKAARGESWWRLLNGVLKAKGERAWVLKARDLSTNDIEIVAIRFSDVPSAHNFSLQYQRVFPPKSAHSDLIQQQPITSPWECSVCTYSNDGTKASCAICGLSASASAAARANRNGDTASIPPNQPPHGSEGGSTGTAPSDDESPWACPQCTFMNGPLALVCSLCRSKKAMATSMRRKRPLPRRPLSNGAPPGSLGNPGPNPQALSPWNCRICTLQNAHGALQCAACGHRRAPTSASPRPPPPPPLPQREYGRTAPIMPVPPSIGMVGPGPIPKMNAVMHSVPTVPEFERAAADIATFNDSPKSIFATLRSVAKKLLKDDIRYRTLDTTNPKVVERLVGFEGVIDFLMLLGFQSDEFGLKLICEQKPLQLTVKHAVDVLNDFEQRVDSMVPIPKRSMSTRRGLNVTAGGPGSPGDGHADDGGGDGQDGDAEPEEDTMTLHQIIIWATHEATRDSQTMETLIITHKTMTDSLSLLKQLRTRFFVQIPREIAKDQNAVKKFRLHVQKSIQLKVIKALRDWMKMYWDEDFSSEFSENGQEMQQEIVSWMEEIDRLPTNDPQRKRVKPLADVVLKEFERFKAKGGDAGKGRSSVISPSIGADTMSKRVHLPDISDEESLVSLLLPMANDESIEIPDGMRIGNVAVDDIADQITLMDFRIFRRIEPRECIGQCWKKKGNKKWAPHIVAMIAQFNRLTMFVQIEILRQQSLRERSRAIKRMIAMGERFKTLRNFNSLCAVLGALNSAPIHRLKLSWKRVPVKYQLMFANFQRIFARDGNNNKNLRNLFKTAPAPAIPHLALFLQDLVFIDDGNSNKIENQNLQKGPMVNFLKCVRITERVKAIELYQHHPYSDKANQRHASERSLEDNAVIQKLLLMEFDRLHNITEDQVWAMSDEIKKLDQRDHKKM